MREGDSELRWPGITLFYGMFIVVPCLHADGDMHVDGDMHADGYMQAAAEKSEAGICWGAGCGIGK